MFILKILFSFFIFANDPHAEKPAANEKKAADIPAWTEVQNRLSQFEAKMRQKEDAIKKLIEQKNHLPANSPKIKEIVDEMVREHRELVKVSEDYEKENTILKFRFPERGAKSDRKYGPVEIKSLEVMEKELGLDGRLSRNQKMLRSQYGEKKSAEENIKPEVKPGHEPVELPQKSIEDSGVIIIKK